MCPREGVLASRLRDSPEVLSSRGTSEFLPVDLAVMTWSAPDKFLAREILES